MTEQAAIEHPRNYMEGSVLRDDLQEILDKQSGIVRQLVAHWKDFGVQDLFLVGSGGSLAVLQPVKWILDRYSEWSVDTYSGWEFIARAPRRVSKTAGAILASHSGTTPEILDGAAFAREREAHVGTFSRPDTPLAASGGIALTYDSIAANLSKLLLGYMVAAEILVKDGDRHIGEGLWDALEALPPRLHEAKEAARQWGLERAKEHLETRGFYLVGTGLLAGLAYQFAICNLIEMHWKHAAVVNASEFAHGPLEIVETGLPMIFLLGADDTNHVTARALEFSRQHGANVLTVDTADYPGFHPLLAPFVAHLPLQWFNWYLGVERDRPISTRRYMGVVEY